MKKPCSPSLLLASAGNSFTLSLQDLEDISLLNAEKAKDIFYVHIFMRIKQILTFSLGQDLDTVF